MFIRHPSVLGRDTVSHRLVCCSSSSYLDIARAPEIAIQQWRRPWHTDCRRTAKIWIQKTERYSRNERNLLYFNYWSQFLVIFKTFTFAGYTVAEDVAVTGLLLCLPSCCCCGLYLWWVMSQPHQVSVLVSVIVIVVVVVVVVVLL